MNDHMKAIALIIFVVLAMGFAGSMELHDLETVRQADVMMADK